MPSKNTEKIYLPDTYYHAYNRGVNKRTIFKDQEDYTVFLNLLKRHLSKQPVFDKKKRAYPWLYNDMELLAYCLMPNHFHLFLYQVSEGAMTQLLRSVCTAYTKYFNTKYKRVGHLFQDRFKASMISNDAYLLHISRYIHLNPRQYLDWEFSSLPYYIGRQSAEWIRPEKILSQFASTQEYLAFVTDYKDFRDSLVLIENEFADFNEN